MLERDGVERMPMIEISSELQVIGTSRVLRSLEDDDIHNYNEDFDFLRR